MGMERHFLKIYVFFRAIVYFQHHSREWWKRWTILWYFLDQFESCFFENLNSNLNQCIWIQFDRIWILLNHYISIQLKLHAMSFNIFIEWNLIFIVFFHHFIITSSA
jgi:hypothetical protein